MGFRVFYDQPAITDDFTFTETSDTGNLTTYGYSGVVAGRHSSMNDVVTANFKARSRRGEVILSPMSKSVHSLVRGPAKVNYNLHHSSKPVGEDYVVVGLPHWPNYDPFLGANHDDFGDLFDQSDDDRNEAIAKAWANVDESEIQLLASLGELPETLRWIASIYRRIIRLTRLYTRKDRIVRELFAVLRRHPNRKAKMLIQLKQYGSIGRATKVADGISNLWLEYRYAIRPLVFEMKQAVEALHKEVKKNDRATGRGFKFVNDVATSSYETTHPNLQTKVLWNRTRSTTADYRAGVLYKIENDLSSLLSVWGIDQPLESMWELIPFSFIIDWVLNVGDLIAMWTDNPGLLPLGSWIVENTIVTDRDFAVSTSVGTMPTSFTCSYGPTISANGFCTHIRMYKRRIINPSQSYVPSVKFNLDLAKIFDLATILRGLLRNGGRVKIGGSNVR